MDHNNKHLLPGISFPAAFAGLPNANSLISTLSLSGLSGPMLQTLSASDLAQCTQWVAQQTQQQQQWLDSAAASAAAAAIYPALYLNAKQLELRELAQQNLHSAVNGTTSSQIFPSLMKQVAAAKVVSPQKEPMESPCAVEPLSNASSSHQSSSTPQEIDVGMVSSTSQTQAFDLSTKTVSPLIKPEPEIWCEPSTSSASSILSNPVASKLSNSSFVSNPWTQASSLLTQMPPTTLNAANTAEDIATDPTDLLASLFPTLTSTSTGPTTTSITSHGLQGMGLASFMPSTSLPTGTEASKRVDVEDKEDHAIDKDLIDFDQINPTDREDASPAFGLFGGVPNDGGLSPVQFTPPDSPTHKSDAEDSAIVHPFSARPTPSSTPFLPAPAPTPMPMGLSVQPAPSTTPKSDFDPFKVPSVAAAKAPKPFAPRPANKVNKVPVYKQKKLGIYKNDEKSGEKESTGDAYSFSDEEEQSITKMDPKDKLDAEVREKLSRMAGQSSENRNKNVYVPGVGFAVPQEQPQQDLWRNVVLKKRPMIENRPIIPSANLLPASVHAEACQVAARLAEPEIVTLAESIRRRKKARYACSFIKTEPTTSTDCVKEEGAEERLAEMQKEMESQPKVPKIVIKIAKRPIDDYKERKKKKKKRKKEEDDSDWEGSRKSKKHKRKRVSESRSVGYEIRTLENDYIKQEVEDVKPLVKEERSEGPMCRKKRILQWQEGQQNRSLENGERKYNGVNGISAIKKINFADFNTDAIKQRLSKFSQADGNVAKGTFVVNKAELFREDCALWKVDNPNMLQKFPPRIDPTTKNITYKSSSTYSGWCEQISSGYYKVVVKFIKQTRSESIVEPEIPLSDLFPAMTTECNDTNGFMKSEEEQPVDPNDHVNLIRDQRKMDLLFLMRVVVDHALTMEHIQSLKDKNDWTFLRALTGVQKINSDCISKIRLNSSMKEETEEVLKKFVKICVADMDSKGFICKHCQACKFEKRPVEKVVHLLGRQPYDPDTLQSLDKHQPVVDENDEEPLSATELYLCGSCATAAQQFHKCHHMLFHLLLGCEDKLEVLGTLHAEYKPELIVEQAKKSRTWQSKIFADILEMWKKIENISLSSIAPVVA